MQTIALALALATAAAAAPGVTRVPLYRHNSALDSLGGASRSSKNVAYYGQFSLGTPPQNFTACFDTGSSDTWVSGALCLSPACTSHARFDPRASSTYKLLPEPFRLVYGTGSVTGSAATETLTLGEPPVSVPKQPFGIVLDTSSDFRATSCDGVIGLGFQTLSVMKYKPLFVNMVEAGLAASPSFGVWLSTNPAAEPAGELALGGPDPARYTGPMRFAPVIDKTYWTVPLLGVKAGGVEVQGLSTKKAILDSGTTAIIMTKEDAKTVHAAIPGIKLEKGGYYNVTGGCKSVNALPDLVFNIAGVDYAVPPRLWVQQIPPGPGDDPDTLCISGIIPGPTSADKGVVLGDSFMRAWYTLFVLGENGSATNGTARIGFAKSAK